MSRQLELASAAVRQSAPPRRQRRVKSTGRGRSSLVTCALVLAISACASRSERGAPLPLETAPDAPWGAAAIDVQHYELRGTTKAKLREEIASVRAARGMRNYGDTQWQIGTRYDFATSGDDCEPTRVDVSLDLRVTLPRLRNPDALSPELQAEWRRFVRALREHETKHKQIAIDCAKQVSTALAAIGSVRCDRLAEAMQSATEEVTSTCHVRNADYDLRTGHGASEGATF